VSALRAKAEINANATRLLDSIAKVLSAGKGMNIFVQQNVQSDEQELEDLLNKAKHEGK